MSQKFALCLWVLIAHQGAIFMSDRYHIEEKRKVAASLLLSQASAILELARTSNVLRQRTGPENLLFQCRWLSSTNVDEARRSAQVPDRLCDLSRWWLVGLL